MVCVIDVNLESGYRPKFVIVILFSLQLNEKKLYLYTYMMYFYILSSKLSIPSMEDVSLRNECIFRDYLPVCTIEDYAEKELTDTRREKVIQSSIRRQDILSSKLGHTQCYQAYTSNEKINRYLKRKAELGAPTTSSSVRPSNEEVCCFLLLYVRSRKTSTREVVFTILR